MFKTSGGKYITTNHHKICDEKTSFYWTMVVVKDKKCLELSSKLILIS
jgi:hypothetical protein